MQSGLKGKIYVPCAVQRATWRGCKAGPGDQTKHIQKMPGVISDGKLAGGIKNGKQAEYV